MRLLLAQVFHRGIRTPSAFYSSRLPLYFTSQASTLMLWAGSVRDGAGAEVGQVGLRHLHLRVAGLVLVVVRDIGRVQQPLVRAAGDRTVELHADRQRLLRVQVQQDQARAACRPRRHRSRGRAASCDWAVPLLS